MGEQKPVEYYNDPSNHWLSSRPLETSPWATLYAAAADILGPPAGRRIVDIGCGSGRFARVLADRGWRFYTGIDWAENLVEMARRYVPEFNFVVADIFSMGARLAIHHADVVVIMETLEHLDADLDLVKTIPEEKEALITGPSFDCASHVRHYTDVGQFMERYGPFFRDFAVTAHVTGDGTYWIGRGIRR